MFNYTIRRLLFTVPVLLFISFVIFLLLDLAPNDPTGNLPMTIPPEVRKKNPRVPGTGRTHSHSLSTVVQSILY